MKIRFFLGGQSPPKPSRDVTPLPPVACATPGRCCTPISVAPRPVLASLKKEYFCRSPLGGGTTGHARRDRVGPPASGVQPSQTLPPGGGWGNPVSPSPCGAGRGETRFPHTPRRGLMFTLAVYAAAPHTAAMKKRLFLGGLRPPRPSRGWGNGKTGFPHSPALAA